MGIYRIWGVMISSGKGGRGEGAGGGIREVTGVFMILHACVG